MNGTVVLGVTGSIAAYKALDIVSKLKKKNIDVNVIETLAATKFVTPLSFQSLSQREVAVEMLEEPKSFEIRHISLAQKADVILIAPSTANIIGKIANGIADDMLTTTVLASKAPVVIAPAMNTFMYENIINQKNMAYLKSIGYGFIEPDSGRLACGTEGKGKLADTETIVDAVEMYLYKDKIFKDKKILVTAGPTREDIDPVRYITNRSSGKMGFAIARAARDMGADVTLISGPTAQKVPFGISFVSTYSAKSMYDAVIQNFEKSDIIIMAAAVADYKPKNISSSKIKKSDEDLYLELERTEDILCKIGNMKDKRIVVGFAAETDNLVENAKTKIEKKNLDAIVLNDVKENGAGFGTDTNTIKIIKRNGEITDFPNMSKVNAAFNIMNMINTLKR